MININKKAIYSSILTTLNSGKSNEEIANMLVIKLTAQIRAVEKIVMKNTIEMKKAFKRDARPFKLSNAEGNGNLLFDAVKLKDIDDIYEQFGFVDDSLPF